ncbi:MAG: metallophosphoesterase [Lachnospiraceae bacterium]
MIYITGDTHGKIDIHKLNTKNFPIQKSLTRDDYVIICGDFGMVWCNDAEDLYWQKWLEQRNFTTLWIDGNHENFDLLATYPVEEWHGGLVQRITPNVIHLLRGQVYEIEGKTFFTMGGAASSDRAYRKEGKSWWPQEMPSLEEYQQAEQKLAEVDYQVDYVLTHTPPSNLLYSLGFGGCYDELTNWLYHEVEKKVTFRHWYFGHMHDDRELDEKHTLLYNQIVTL